MFSLFEIRVYLKQIVFATPKTFRYIHKNIIALN